MVVPPRSYKHMLFTLFGLVPAWDGQIRDDASEVRSAPTMLTRS